MPNGTVIAGRHRCAGGCCWNGRHFLKKWQADFIGPQPLRWALGVAAAGDPHSPSLGSSLQKGKTRARVLHVSINGVVAAAIRLAGLHSHAIVPKAA